MTGFAFEIARDADAAAIGELLAQSDLPGWIDLSYRATPGLHGMPHPRADSRTLVARGPEGLAGMVTQSTFPGFLGGGAQSLAYLGQFRIAPAARRRVKLLRQAFQACGRLFGTTWAFASLLQGNLPAERLLTAGLPGFPTVAPVGRFSTLVLRSLRLNPLPGIRQALPEDMPAVAEFHRAHLRPLAPVLKAEDLAMGRWPGLAPHDFLVAEHAGRLVGLVALWDQGRFRQLQVTGYRQPLAALRGLVNAVGPLTGFPHLPPVGESLSLGYLSFLTVQPGDQSTALRLIAAARGLAGSRGLPSVAVGLAADDPFLSKLRGTHRGASYGSCIYTVAWQDGPTPPPGALTGMRPEIALL